MSVPKDVHLPLLGQDLSHVQPCLQERLGVQVFLLLTSVIEKAKERQGWNGSGVYWPMFLP